MPMTLYFKRAKSFVQSDDNGTKKFLAQPSPNPETRVPFWVANTETFKRGIADKSIVNLTPPEHMPGYKPAPVAVVADEESDNAADAQPADQFSSDDEDEQAEAPKAPFGGQPMTPVPPAPKVGGVRANTKR